MNKEWFIFKGTHHQGPYSIEEMEDFFHAGELTIQSLVWREGSEKWEALGKTGDLQFLINKPTKKPALPDDLPPLPEEMPPKAPTKLLKTAPVPELDEGPPPIPLDALLNPEGNKHIFKKEESAFAKNAPKILFSSLLFIFVIVLGWFFMNERSSSIQIRVKGLMPVYLEKLQEIATQKTPGVAVGMALSLDGKTLYATTNMEGEILTLIKLQSIPKRTLGIEDVEIMVRGVIKNHLGEYARMQLTKGAQFVPGEYNIDYTGRKLHFLNRKFKFLNQYSFFKKLNTTYNYKTSALIYAGTPREFEKKLSEYKESILSEMVKPYSDKLERQQTFLSLLNKTMEDYLLVLENLKKPKDIVKFEKQYIKEVSPIVQSLVVAANELYKKTEMQEDDSRKTVAGYEHQVQLGKQIGEMASDMITETGSLKKLTANDRSALRTKFEARYKVIKAQIDSNIVLLQDQIQKISN